jgi:hypothetical protein
MLTLTEEERGRIKQILLENSIWVEGSMPTPCHVWQGSLDGKGYGQVRWKGRGYRAHRLSFLAHYGEIPPKKQINHHCKIPACHNHTHVYAGTQRQNIRESCATKLNVQKVAEIKFYLEQGKPQTWIAKQFGMNVGTINDIARGRTWREVEAWWTPQLEEIPYTKTLRELYRATEPMVRRA